jgi:hypothetical protein
LLLLSKLLSNDIRYNFVYLVDVKHLNLLFSRVVLHPEELLCLFKFTMHNLLSRTSWHCTFCNIYSVFNFIRRHKMKLIFFIYLLWQVYLKVMIQFHFLLPFSCVKCWILSANLINQTSCVVLCVHLLKPILFCQWIFENTTLDVEWYSMGAVNIVD